MPSVHGRKDRKIITLNEYNQPVGPTKEVVQELDSFLGTLARSETFCPLNVFNWRKLDTKDDMWKYIKEKYDIPGEAKQWIFESVCSAWRKYESQLKTNHFKAYENEEFRMENRPVDVRMGPEHPVRVRLYGRGVTKTLLKGQKGILGSSLDADERMQQKIEEIEERMQQRMHEKLNEQKDAMEQNITMNVIARFQRLNPDLRLDPDMLRFSARSLVDASSAQQTTIQLNSRPYAGSNTQGGVDQEMDDEDDKELDLT
ncbi:uncharacterized protein LOC107814148 isoform X2 [Nicotiana tabacum]|uniref:Uncharacterized protein LOC107814148 isoform X2 n=2 Tax=Nicotiana TaxID=4085 RepID=A0A1S4C1E7_TOBAC|nr:PREDICTED: uncharacterized protein LOC104249632 isoform X2 [Nicotiana sylvestris]XP_016494980.1 PREDICTED: uncharacterized protein LOC107814148 isoform X2 [Nicotiana tabacum]